MSAHTPGPWTWAADHPQNACAHIKAPTPWGTLSDIVTVWAAPSELDILIGDPHPERDANARLIAAAPELLEALEKASETVGHLSSHLRGRMGEAALLELAQLADEWSQLIETAKGGES